MEFRIRGLDPAAFRPLFGLSDADLEAQGARRYVVDRKPAFPDRIEMRDLEVGETALLVNYVHQPAANAYRASHAIFVREGAEASFEAVGVVPEVMQIRPLSLRAFDGDDMMVEADLTSGNEAEAMIRAFLADPRVAYIHAHYAKRGCFAARIDRVQAALIL